MTKKPEAELSFSTRQDAETYIIENELAGIKKPRRLGRWFLVDNETGMIPRTLFTRVVAHQLYKQTGERPDPIQTQEMAAGLWKQLMRQHRTVGRKPNRKAQKK